MEIEHLNLVVKDLARTLTFYQAAFPHWYVRGKGEQTWYGTARKWVHFGDENHFITFNDSGTDSNRELTGNSVGLAHFGFITQNIDSVITRLKHAGFDIHKTGAENTFRQNVYFLDPDGFEVEFVQYFSDQPQERNAYE